MTNFLQAMAVTLLLMAAITLEQHIEDGTNGHNANAATAYTASQHVAH